MFQKYISPVAGIILVKSQHSLLHDDHTYSSVNNTQQMFVLSHIPAYKTVSEQSQQSLQEDDQIYSNFDISQQEAVVLFGNPEQDTALRAAASVKRQAFLLQCQQVNCFSE